VSNFTRRSFLRNSTAAAIGAGSFFSTSNTVAQIQPTKAKGANETINIAIIGLGSKGNHHIRMNSIIENVKIAAVCDPDLGRLNAAIKTVEELNGYKPYGVQDFRKILDDKDIDAVTIATPNHWHCLIGILACQAGKDVYVEKPISHNISEGRKLVEAARKYKRIVQSGTHSRSDLGLKEAFEYIQAGNIGEVTLARGLCYKRRPSIGHVTGPKWVSENIDYDLWCGPAAAGPLMRNGLHYNWHWAWATGNGDLGNQGAHEMDMCRWAMGENRIPERVMSFGGRLGYVDDGETANTQVAYLDYGKKGILFEVRGLPMAKGLKSMDSYKGVRIGVVIECEDGYFAGGAGGGWIYNSKGEKLKQFAKGGGDQHAANFIKAVRSRKVSDLNCDIEQGHISSTMCHMANVSYASGGQVLKEQTLEAIGDHAVLKESYDRFEKHLAQHEVDLNTTKITIGKWMGFDAKKEKFIGSGRAGLANLISQGSYRKPYLIPEKI